MYTKQEAARLRQTFWTRFGQYMSPVPSAEGVKINWINYKTGIKDLHFTMQADAGTATISILLSQPNASQQTFYFDRFVQCKSILEDALQEEWQWGLHMQDENNKTVSAVYTELAGVSILKEENWPLIISFFKPRIIALDAFWTAFKPAFE